VVTGGIVKIGDPFDVVDELDVLVLVGEPHTLACGDGSGPHAAALANARRSVADPAARCLQFPARERSPR
jgi:hypothetical protein